MDADIRLTKKTAPTGSRLLVYTEQWACRTSYTRPQEVQVVEWSREGRVKLRFAASGACTWYETKDIPFFVERIG